MKISWGLKITLLYSGFVALILTLVIASSHQHFDLVSKDYYADEIAYQKVLDANKNDAALASPVTVHADAQNVVIEFPAELKDKSLTGTVQFYSPVNAAWDRQFTVDVVNGSMIISRDKLRDTRYTVKVSFTAADKKYYQESDINLHS